VDDGLGREDLEVLLAKEHHVDVFLKDEAAGNTVGVLLVKLKAQFSEEGHGLFNVRHTDIDEDALGSCAHGDRSS